MSTFAEKEEQLRVLHAVGSLNRGGIETWLMNMLRQQPKTVHFDFVVSTPGGTYEEEAKTYGAKIFSIPPTSRFRKRLDIVGFGRGDCTIKEVLTAGNYQVFHVHGTEFLGDAVKIAAKCGVRVRAAHCHTTGIGRFRRNPELWLRGLRFRTLDRHRILKYATDILAVSRESGRFLMSRHWDTDKRCKTLYCGVPPQQFVEAQMNWTRDAFRRANGIPSEAIVVGHAGSMWRKSVKNHSFLLKIFAELARRSDRYHLFMAGDGPRRAILKREAEEQNLRSRVFLPGLCNDVPSLMIHGFDVHVLPSLYEGLPIVGLEAVAAGLYTVCSDTITKDFTEPLAERVKPLSLNASVENWADEIERAIAKRIPAQQGIAVIKRSPFSLGSSLENLLAIYRRPLHAHQ
jgi:glycosyltransferase involved in cell wall biosynthesis